MSFRRVGESWKLVKHTVLLVGAWIRAMFLLETCRYLNSKWEVDLKGTAALAGVKNEGIEMQSFMFTRYPSCSSKIHQYILFPKVMSIIKPLIKMRIKRLWT